VPLNYYTFVTKAMVLEGLPTCGLGGGRGLPWGGSPPAAQLPWLALLALLLRRAVAGLRRMCSASSRLHSHSASWASARALEGSPVMASSCASTSACWGVSAAGCRAEEAGAEVEFSGGGGCLGCAAVGENREAVSLPELLLLLLLLLQVQAELLGAHTQPRAAEGGAEAEVGEETEEAGCAEEALPQEVACRGEVGLGMMRDAAVED
jgi:hypothetical protein